jgi:uracil-DNA glycosylase family 4
VHAPERERERAYGSPLLRGGGGFILSIVPEEQRDTAIPGLREWLRNERRLGVPHWSVGRAEGGVADNPAPGPSGSRERARPASLAVTPPLIREDSDLPPLCDRELSEAEAQQALAELDDAYVKGCTKCGLHASRKQTVFGVGCARPAIVFVGEGPGAEEDHQGLPFVGRAGQLLTRMIAAMTLTRDQVYIGNIVKCRPPGNRTPTEDEARICLPYLYRQLAILRPRVIVALGRPAAQALLQTNTPIGRLRGEFHDFPPLGLQHLGLPPAKVMPTFHPAYLLRSPGEKVKAWEDLKQVMRYLGIPIPRGHS